MSEYAVNVKIQTDCEKFLFSGRYHIANTYIIENSKGVSVYKPYVVVFVIHEKKPVAAVFLFHESQYKQHTVYKRRHLYNISFI